MLFFTFDEEELVSVNMNSAPTSGQEYLKQVVMSRKNLPAIVVADLTCIPTHHQQPSNHINETSSCKSFQSTTPPRWWCDKQCSDFSELRQKLRRSQARMKKLRVSSGVATLKFPNLNDEEAWRKFCFRKWHDAVAKTLPDEQLESLKRIHKGTPPLVTVLLGMGQPRIVDALEFHISWFIEEGYSEARMQWLFALMCILEKPLDPDVCSSLRELAKNCVHLRSVRAGEGADTYDYLIRSYNWFICIVAYYFEQRDLVELL